jgi:pyrroline-5-carboxylate reductase
MIESVAFIGVGHLASYMITGLRNVDRSLKLHLFNRTFDKTANFTQKDEHCFCYKEAQQAVDVSDLVVISTRPDDVEAALKDINFSKNHIVISVAAGIDIAQLKSLAGPAQIVRAMPISCVAVNKSPTLIYPHHDIAYRFFNKLGQVHSLQSEQQFNPATALVGAYYAWLFPMMGQLNDWAVKQGLEKSNARQLITEINQGACAMAVEQSDTSFDDIWQSLATKGGISDRGKQTIDQLGGIEAWCTALSDVTQMMNVKKEYDDK